MRKTVTSRIGERIKDKRDAHRLKPQGGAQAGHPHSATRDRQRTGRTMTFADGSRLAVDAVMWATGYVSTTPSSRCPSPTTRGGSGTGAASPRSLACTSSGCPGSTRGVGTAGLGQRRRTVHRAANCRRRSSEGRCRAASAGALRPFGTMSTTSAGTSRRRERCSFGIGSGVCRVGLRTASLCQLCNKRSPSR